MRVLIVEDDAAICSFIAGGLREAGFAVDESADGEEGFDLARQNPYDALVVDIMLPGRDGLSLIEGLRRLGNDTPVLILSARHTVDDKVRGFQKGGDDYLTKPYSFTELLVRLQALIRRSRRGAGGAGPLTVADLSLDPLARRVLRGGRAVELQPKELSLLEYLMRNEGMVVSKTMILEHVWDYRFDPQTNVVDVLVHRLRSKIDRDFEPKLLHTVRGAGYVLKTS